MKCKHFLRAGVLMFSVAVCTQIAGCVTLEESIIFQPPLNPGAEWEQSDLPHADAWFKSADGTQLHGWFASPHSPRAVVLYCHGNGGDVSGWAGILGLYSQKLNCAILLFDYRGYGKSAGTPTEQGILADARAARAWLAERTGVAEKDVVVAGRSLGGGVAVDLAAKEGARGLVLESTFTSLRDVVDSHVFSLPVSRMMKMNLNSLALIHRYHGPLLQTHGDADGVVPFEEGQQLFQAANEPKTFVTGRGKGHNDLPTREFIEALDNFLRDLPPETAAQPNLIH